MEIDPRAQNCRGVKLDGQGRVIGVELEWVAQPSALYRLASVTLIDEIEAAGNTVAKFAVIDAAGLPVYERVYLAWPWPDMTEKALPGNPNQEHMIANGYNPPNMGPLALYVGDAQGNAISDLIGGLGLPWNRHVSFNLVFQECGDDNNGNGGDDDDASTVVALLERIADRLDQLASHLGA